MSTSQALNTLLLNPVREKVLRLPESIQSVWTGEFTKASIPLGAPGRDIEVGSLRGHSGKKKIGKLDGQAQLLHELANIELQAMELAYRSFVEYPEAPKEFREQMADLALAESQHLILCLDELEKLGFQWGHWPVHLNLWSAVSAEDSLLDRLLIVHRYLEASGLDSGSALLTKLKGTTARDLERTVKKITEDEVDHVLFGSHWYQNICREQKVDADEDFRKRLDVLSVRLPRRVEMIDRELRTRAGFTPGELQTVEDYRVRFLPKNAVPPAPKC